MTPVDILKIRLREALKDEDFAAEVAGLLRHQESRPYKDSSTKSPQQKGGKKAT